MNLTPHSRKRWREAGYFVDDLEHISRIGERVRRHDLLGFGDLMAIKVGEIVIIQVTSWSNVSARLNKIRREDYGRGQYARPMKELAKIMLSVFGVRIVIEGWRKRNGRWESRQVEVTPTLLDKKRGTK